jgi:hypothetical protein
MIFCFTTLILVLIFNCHKNVKKDPDPAGSVTILPPRSGPVIQIYGPLDPDTWEIFMVSERGW